jgi:RNA polymerase primary sigma factor
MDGPFIDLAKSANWLVIRQAERRGYITTEELDRLLPLQVAAPEQIEDVIDQLAEAGIDLVEEEESLGSRMSPPANSNEPSDLP